MFHTKDDNKDDIEPEIKISEVQREESLPDFDSLLPPLIIDGDDDDDDNEKVVEGLYLIYLLRYIIYKYISLREAKLL